MITKHRAPCSRCGAKTEKQAERMCRPMPVGDTGEYDCPGEDMDDEGFILQPTPEYLAAEAALYEAHAQRETAIEALMAEIDPECWGDGDRWHAARAKAEAKFEAAEKGADHA